MVSELDSNLLQFVMTATSAVKTFEVDPMVSRLVRLLDGTRTVADLDAELRPVDGYSPARLREVLDFMRAERLIVDYSVRTDDCGLDHVELERYDRQLRFLTELSVDNMESPADGIELQRRLRRATVAVIGAGGVGSWVLASLAAAGVGRLKVFDFDRLERSNLSRQVLYRSVDVGSQKLEAVRQNLHALNPHVRLECSALRLTDEVNLRPMIRDADVVVNCADQPSVALTSEWIAAACVPLGQPHIVGGSYAFQRGTIGMTVVPGTTACWGCLRSVIRDDLRLEDVPMVPRSRPARGGSMPMFPAIVGNLAVWDAIRLVLGLRPLLANRVGEIDFETLEIMWRPIDRQPDCRLCRNNNGQRNDT
jgi:molybdopterin/thiamine biosynthesis adenylyltransferase